MTLLFLQANQAWVFAFGDSILCLEGEDRFFPTRALAYDAAKRKGLRLRRVGRSAYEVYV